MLSRHKSLKCTCDAAFKPICMYIYRYMEMSICVLCAQIYRCISVYATHLAICLDVHATLIWLQSDCMLYKGI